MARRVLFFVFCIIFTGLALGEEGVILPGVAGGTGVPDIFNPALARKPRPGDWLEYRVAVPVDPLEDLLGPAPLGTGEGGESESVVSADGYEYFYYKPSFEPETPWLVLPVRLEVREVDEGGCNVFMTFSGRNHQFYLPMENGGPEGEFVYEAPQEEDRRILIRMNGAEFEVEAVRRRGDSYGFVRYFSREVPFGVVRFATRDVDLVLVAMGNGRPPAFPVAVADKIEPPPGKLYAP